MNPDDIEPPFGFFVGRWRVACVESRGRETMAVRTKPPFRADHVGSLLRPPALLEAPADAAEGEAVGGAVRMQEEVGLRGITDGEFRRSAWHMDFIYELDGISTADDKV